MARRRKHNKDLPPRVYLSHGRYFYADPETGKWFNMGATKSEMYRNMAEKFVDGRPPRTMAEVFRRYRLEVVPRKAEKTQRENSRAIKRLEGVFGHMNPRAVRPSDIYAYRYKRGRKTEFGANRDLEVLSHAFSKAIEWGVADSNPCREVRKFPEPKRRRYVTDAEYLTVYELASPTVQTAMDLAVLTGLRRGDILSLTRDHLTDEGILIQTSKTDKALLIEWSDELRAVVKRARQLPPETCQPIVATGKGTPYTSDGFYAIWQRLMVKAIARGKIQERFQFRDLRAKSASDDTLEAATQRLGHADPRITETVYRRKPASVRPGKLPG